MQVSNIQSFVCIQRLFLTCLVARTVGLIVYKSSPIVECSQKFQLNKLIIYVFLFFIQSKNFQLSDQTIVAVAEKQK